MPAFKYSKPYAHETTLVNENQLWVDQNNLSKELQMIDRPEPDTFHTKTFKLVLVMDRNCHQCTTQLSNIYSFLSSFHFQYLPHK